MQQQEFERSISKFFEKAGVRLIKKGEGYDDNNGFPSYILLDSKRKAYYFAETDIQAIDAETETSVAKFTQDSGLSQNAAYALYRIGQDVSVNDNKFTLVSDDLSAFDCKSALVISEESSEEVSNYLNSNAYQYQTVPLKGQFIVIFFDKGMEEKLIELYNKYNAIAAVTDDDIAPVYAPKEDGSVEDIDLSAPKQNSFDAETPLVEPKAEQEKNNTQTDEHTGDSDENTEDKEEEELLDSIDLSDILKPAQENETPEDETEAELLYGKLLSEQADKIEVSNSGPVEKSLDELPVGLISEDEIKDMVQETVDGETVDEKKEAVDKKAAKLKIKEEKKQAKLAKKHEKNDDKKQEKNIYKDKKWLDVPGKIAANIIGVIFFLPVYILNKLVGKFLPPFVLYWLGAIITIFGGYMIFTPFFNPLNTSFLNEINNAISIIQNYKADVADGQAVSDIVTTSVSMIKSSAVTYYGFLKAVDIFIYNGNFLQYMLIFGAVLMIFPACRFIGKTFTIFSVLSYFILPVIVYLQSIMIKYSINLPEVSLTAAAVNFTVYIYPLLMLFIILFISSALVPDRNIRKEVLP